MRFSAGGVSVAFQRRRLSSLRCVSAQEVSPLRFAQETVTNPMTLLADVVCKATQEVSLLRTIAGETSAASFRLNSSAAIRRRDSSAKQRWRFLCCEPPQEKPPLRAFSEYLRCVTQPRFVCKATQEVSLLRTIAGKPPLRAFAFPTVPEAILPPRGNSTSARAAPRGLSAAKGMWKWGCMKMIRLHSLRTSSCGSGKATNIFDYTRFPLSDSEESRLHKQKLHTSLTHLSEPFARFPRGG